MRGTESGKACSIACVGVVHPHQIERTGHGSARSREVRRPLCGYRHIKVSAGYAYLWWSGRRAVGKKEVGERSRD